MLSREELKRQIEPRLSAVDAAMVKRTLPNQWACCVGGALPEEEYTCLIGEAGFAQVLCTRGPDSRQVGHIRTYSVNISAVKPPKESPGRP